MIELKQKLSKLDKSIDWSRYANWICNLILIFCVVGLVYWIGELIGLAPIPVK